MRPRFGMHGDDIGAGLGEGLEIAIDRAIIRCTSKIFLVTGRIAAITGGPKVMLGTKCPSITSMWIQSAPASSIVRTSSPSLAKSAERMDGAI